MRYRKKPVEIDAWQWDGDPCSFAFAPDWVVVDNDGEDNYFIETLEGDMYVSPGDYVIRGIAGEIYPCKPDIFEKTYEKVEV